LTEEAREGRDEKKFGVLVVGCRPEPLQPAGREKKFAWVVGEASFLACLRCCNCQSLQFIQYYFSRQELRTWEEIDAEIACVALRAEGRMQKLKAGSKG
jgi:hypothetical protein